MSAFIFDFKKAFRAPVALTLWLLVAVFLAVSGPFGAYVASPFWLRSVISFVIVLYAAIVGTALRVLLAIYVPKWSFVQISFAHAVLTVIAVAPPVYALLAVLAGMKRLNLPNAVDLMLLVGALSLAFSSLRNIAKQEVAHLSLGNQNLHATATATATVRLQQTPEPARLLRRIDAEYHGELYAISVRDHYVDVQTSAGSFSLLLRLSDAMAETAPIEGTQVHRSHWVAWQAISAPETEAGKLYLRLHNGARVPVSKNHREKLKARALI